MRIQRFVTVFVLGTTLISTNGYAQGTFQGAAQGAEEAIERLARWGPLSVVPSGLPREPWKEFLGSMTARAFASTL